MKITNSFQYNSVYFQWKHQLLRKFVSLVNVSMKTFHETGSRIDEPSFLLVNLQPYKQFAARSDVYQPDVNFAWVWFTWTREEGRGHEPGRFIKRSLSSLKIQPLTPLATERRVYDWWRNDDSCFTEILQFQLYSSLGMKLFFPTLSTRLYFSSLLNELSSRFVPNTKNKSALVRIIFRFNRLCSLRRFFICKK